MADVFTKEKRSWVMSRIRGKHTKVELLLRRELRRHGLRYRLYPRLPGRPDVAFPGAKLAVFVDGDFWHGRNWRRLREKLATRFWYEKILGNIRRDRKVNRELGRLGWRVLRIWETEVERAPATFGDKIKGLVEGQGGTDTH